MSQLFPGTKKGLLNQIVNLIERRMRQDNRVNKPLEPGVESGEGVPVTRANGCNKGRWLIGRHHVRV